VKRLLPALFLLAVVLLCGAFACKEKAQPGMMMRPAQSAELALGEVALAQRTCANRTWGAALETLLAREGVDMKQDYWVVRAYGGASCRSDVGDPAVLARVITGDYTLDGGRKVRLEATYITGAPRAVDELLLRLHNGHPFLLFWNSQVYLVRGAVYDEYIAPTGERLFQVRELKLVDLHPQARQRETTFDREQHDPASIQALMLVSVLPRPGTDWQRSN
jgi:hypothetical protein